MFPNRSKQIKMDQMDRNGSKWYNWIKADQNGPKRVKLDHKGSKWIKLDHKG